MQQKIYINIFFNKCCYDVCTFIMYDILCCCCLFGWCSSVVDHRSLTSELSLVCTRPTADG